MLAASLLCPVTGPASVYPPRPTCSGHRGSMERPTTVTSTRSSQAAPDTLTLGQLSPFHAVAMTVPILQSQEPGSDGPPSPTAEAPGAAEDPGGGLSPARESQDRGSPWQERGTDTHGHLALSYEQPTPSPRGISEQGFPEPDSPPGPSQATSSSKASLAWPSGLSSALGGLSQTHRPASPRPDPRHRALSVLDVVPECPGPSGQLSRAFPPSSHNYSNPTATFWAPLVAKASKRKRWDDSGVAWPQEMCPCDDIW